MLRYSFRNFAKIFVSNLPNNFELVEIEDITPAKASYKLSKSFCFINLDNDAEAQDLVTKLNGLKIRGKVLRAKLDEYDSKNKKNAGNSPNLVNNFKKPKTLQNWPKNSGKPSKNFSENNLGKDLDSSSEEKATVIDTYVRRKELYHLRNDFFS